MWSRSGDDEHSRDRPREGRRRLLWSAGHGRDGLWSGRQQQPSYSHHLDRAESSPTATSVDDRRVSSDPRSTPRVVVVAGAMVTAMAHHLKPAGGEGRRTTYHPQPDQLLLLRRPQPKPSVLQTRTLLGWMQRGRTSWLKGKCLQEGGPSTRSASPIQLSLSVRSRTKGGEGGPRR